ncbi:hypothetical protein JCM11491_000520 [Sporobolomyces phaffii]
MSTIDYAQLGQAYRYLPEPTRLRQLDRTAVLGAHADLDARERGLDAAGQVRTRRVMLGGGKHYSPIALERLEPTTLSSGRIRVDEVAHGRCLVCRVITSPVRTASVQFVVQDSQNFVMPVSLFHVPASFDSRDLSDIYPIGASFAVKEPFVRSTRDGCYIRIEAPSDLVRLYPKSPLLRSVSSSFSSTHALHGRTAEESKTVGNKAFQAKRWHAAKEAYTWSLSILPDPDAVEPDRAGTTLRATLLSNLAATNLKLSLPSSAQRNCISALALFPASATTCPSTALERKLLYRLSLSYYALGDYSTCISTLSALVPAAPNPNDSDAIDLTARARSRLEGQLRANYDFPSLYRQARSGSNVELDVADYFARDAVGVCPVKGKGRGLVARRAVQRGELLVVCKPVAWAGSLGSGREAGGSEAERNEAKRLQYLSGVNLWTESEDPWTVNEVIAQVAWKVAEGEGGVRDAVEDLWSGDETGRAEAGVNAANDVSRIEGVVTFNGFRIEDLVSSTQIDPSSEVHPPSQTSEADLSSPPTALYPSLPSALNHSCLPNASYTFLSSVFILRARRDLDPGEEILISYLDQTASLEERQEKLGKHGFVCRCALCNDEQSVGATIRREREILKKRARESIADGGLAIKQLVEWKAKMERTYETAPGPIPRIRSSLYPVTRLLSQAYASQGQYRDSITTEMEGLAALGATFDSSGGKVRLVHAPLVGDTDAVLSALWIAKMWRSVGDESMSSEWTAAAVDIERGQSGVELFELRYKQ